MASHAARLADEASVTTPVTIVAELSDEDRQPSGSALDEALIEKVKAALPAQPWADGTHKAVAVQLGISASLATRYISELIRRGDFIQQVDGQLLPDGG